MTHTLIERFAAADATNSGPRRLTPSIQSSCSSSSSVSDPPALIPALLTTMSMRPGDHVGAVYVCVGHDDDAVIAQPVDVELVAPYSTAERSCAELGAARWS
jgi:hypothetical protein